MVHPTNHIWKVGNLHCALSVSWFTLRTIFSKPVIYVVNLREFEWFFNRQPHFTVYRRTWFTLRNFSLVWGSLRLAPINFEKIFSKMLDYFRNFRKLNLSKISRYTVCTFNIPLSFQGNTVNMMPRKVVKLLSDLKLPPLRIAYQGSLMEKMFH